MRTAFAAGLFCLTALAAAAQPDEARRVWHWPKEKSFKDGPTRLEVSHLTGEADGSEWELSLLVVGDKTGEPDPVRGARFVGVKAADDRGNSLAFKQFPQTPHNLGFAARPDARAKSVVIQFGPHPDRTGLTIIVPAATVRGLTAKTSYYRKAAP